MKKYTLVIIAFLMSMIFPTNILAFAEEIPQTTVYPDDSEFVKTLSFTGLYDYALNSKAYVFADGKSIKMFEDDNLYKYDLNENIFTVDCIDNVFYCATESGKVYSLPYTANQAPIEKTLTPKTTTIDIGDYNYRLTPTALKIANYVDDTITSLKGEYKNLKVIQGSVYAMLGNSVFKFTGVEKEEIVLNYIDHSSTTTIFVGESKTALKQYSAPKIVKVKVNASMTQVDLKSIPETYFLTAKTVKAKENETALLLCYSGNAAVISIGDSAYILAKANVEETEETSLVTPEFEYGKITATGCKIYSLPYLADSLAILNGTTGVVVKITGKRVNGVIDGVFFEVEIVNGSETIKGYIKEQFLLKTEYVGEDFKKPTEISEEQILSNNVVTVLIIMGVVVLVTLFLGYIAFKSSQDKNAPAKKKDKKIKMDLPDLPSDNE